MAHRPTAVLLAPPIYDFALHDLFLKPFGLLRIGRWLADAGYDIRFVNGLDYTDPITTSRLGPPARKRNGTGKFFRRRVSRPAAFDVHRVPVDRSFARYGVDVDVLAEAVRRAVGESSGSPADVALVASGMTYWHLGVAEAISHLRKASQKLPVVLGGVYATLCSEHAMIYSGADAVVAGASPETELGAFLSRLGLPVPDAPIPEEPLAASVFADAGVLRLNTGCPMRCDYCASVRLAPRFKPGRPRAAVDRIDSLYRAQGTTNFGIYDDALLVEKAGALRPFLEELLRRYSPSPFSFYLPNAVHVRYLDEDTAGLMLRAGFREIRFGIESSQEEFHHRHGEKTSWEQTATAVEVARRAGFPAASISGYVLAGLPGETAAEVELTLRDTASLGVRARIAAYSPVPGTRLWGESLRRSRYPIEAEPLFHNPTLLPLEWEGFTRADVSRLRRLSLELTRDR